MRGLGNLGEIDAEHGRKAGVSNAPCIKTNTCDHNNHAAPLAPDIPATELKVAEAPTRVPASRLCNEPAPLILRCR